jgi:hypothetical protein
MLPIDSDRRALQNEYHIIGGLWVLPIAEWLKRSPSLKGRGFDPAPKSQFLILLSKVIKFFAYLYFYAGNTMVLFFFHENFWKNLKNIFFEIFGQKIYCSKIEFWPKI